GLDTPGARLFAKNGLLIRAGASFDLVVPSGWEDRFAIGWGSPPTRATHVVVSGCDAGGVGIKWLAFAGGYWVRRAACVPLIVQTTHKSRTVHIGVGAPCRGQRTPPTGR